MEIKENLKNYLSESLLNENEASEVTYSTELISSGLINSISIWELVNFIETEYGVEFLPHEVTRENLDTIEIIEGFILKRRSNK